MTYFPPQPGKDYIIGVDPAGGGSEGDYACAQVIDRASGMQCAELRGHLTPAELASRVAILSRDYNMALVAVERNNHGHAVLGHLGMLHADVPRVSPERARGLADECGHASADAGEPGGGAVGVAVLVYEREVAGRTARRL